MTKHYGKVHVQSIYINYVYELKKKNHIDISKNKHHSSGVLSNFYKIGSGFLRD